MILPSFYFEEFDELAKSKYHYSSKFLSLKCPTHQYLSTKENSLISEQYLQRNAIIKTVRIIKK